MNWWTGLPGLDTSRPAPRALADRVTALTCAARLHPWDSSAGAYGSPRTHRAAEVFLIWLADAGGEAEAYVRRLALCLACTEPGPDPHQRQVILAAKEIAGFLAKDGLR